MDSSDCLALLPPVEPEPNRLICSSSSTLENNLMKLHLE